MSSSIGTLQSMLARVGIRVTRKDLNSRSPYECSLAERWAIAKANEVPGEVFVPPMPPWLKSYAPKRSK